LAKPLKRAIDNSNICDLRENCFQVKPSPVSWGQPYRAFEPQAIRWEASRSAEGLFFARWHVGLSLRHRTLWKFSSVPKLFSWLYSQNLKI